MEAIVEHHYQRTMDLNNVGGVNNKLVELMGRSPSSGSLNAKEKINESKKNAVALIASDFHFSNHFYPKVQRSKIGAVGKRFFQLGNDAVVSRYCQLNPQVDRQALAELLAYRPKYFKWAGCDLFNVTDGEGRRQMIIIETNSCPSGIKSMPRIDESNEFGSYKRLIGSIWEGELSSVTGSGELAVVYDKNLMEASGYAAILSGLAKERVWLVEYLVDNEEDKENCSRNVQWRNDGYMYVRDKFDQWHKLRACLRYVTQKPWTKLPVNTKTVVLNPLVACLAGGRNKIIASYAYKRFNEEMAARRSNLAIRMPYSIINVKKRDIPRLIANDPVLNGKAVIKVPYSNCGQGVYTIMNQQELDEFMSIDHGYDMYILQSLVASRHWASSSNPKPGQYFHVGTRRGAQALDVNGNPATKFDNNDDESYVFDIRLTVTTNSSGFLPVSMNFRKARKPLLDDESRIESSWDVLGTNLSVKLDKNAWDTETERLIVLDDECIDNLMLDEDDLIDSYIQTVFSVIAIDKLCCELHDEQGRFDFERFQQMNPDYCLLNEIRL